MKICAKVPGKLIILGEYAVLEGANAIVMAVDRYAIVTVEFSDQSDICQLTTSLDLFPLRFKFDKMGKIITDSSISRAMISNMNFSLTAVERICDYMFESGFQNRSFNLHIDTSQFYMNSQEKKLGLGSSAAMTVAIISALARFSGLDRQLFSTPFEFFKFAFRTHSLAQNNQGSGIDIAASVLGGIVFYNMVNPEKVRETEFEVQQNLIPGLYLLPVWTGISTSTQKLLVLLREFATENSGKYKQVMKKLTHLSNEGVREYRLINLHSFLDIIQEYYQVLKDFSLKSGIPIISDIHGHIAKIVYAGGGYYKPSGAGGGDLGIAFFDTLEKLENVKANLLSRKIEPVMLGISSQGGYK
jgi:phosphomevalonate kinase